MKSTPMRDQPRHISITLTNLFERFLPPSPPLLHSAAPSGAAPSAVGAVRVVGLSLSHSAPAHALLHGSFSYSNTSGENSGAGYGGRCAGSNDGKAQALAPPPQAQRHSEAAADVEGGGRRGLLARQRALAGVAAGSSGAAAKRGRLLLLSHVVVGLRGAIESVCTKNKRAHAGMVGRHTHQCCVRRRLRLRCSQGNVLLIGGSSNGARASAIPPAGRVTPQMRDAFCVLAAC